LGLHAGRTGRNEGGELTPDESRPIRLSYGLDYQLAHASHMQRIKIPGGMLTAEQMDAMAAVADRYGRGIGHVTTRQDIQIHWVPIEASSTSTSGSSRPASRRAARAPTACAT